MDPQPSFLKAVHPWRRFFEAVLTGLASLCLMITIWPLSAILIFVVRKGFHRLNGDLITQLPPAAGLTGGGIGNAIIGTLVLVTIATGISLPIGVLAAVFVSEFSPKPLARWIRFATNVLSGVPSLLAGIFGYAVLVLTTKTFSAIAGGTALAIVMIPTIVRTTEEALRQLPDGIRQASVGLGASTYQTVLRVVLPAAGSSILTGALLSIARAAGETAPLVFTASFSYFWIRSLQEPTPSLAILIYNFAGSPFKSQQELAWAAALGVVILVLVISVSVRLALEYQRD